MKILHVAQIHWHNAEVQYAWDLAAALARRGHECHALTRPGTVAMQRAEEAGLTVLGEDGFNAKGIGAVRAIPAWFRMRELLRRERYDAVLIHRSEGLPLIAHACVKECVPAVRVRGDMRAVRPGVVNRWVYDKLLDAVVASNSAIARQLSERLDVDAKVIPGGVDETRFTPYLPNAGIKRELKLEPGAFLVGLLGRMTPHKGWTHLLDAAKYVLRQAPHAAFVLVIKHGLPPLPEVRERLKADHILADRVRILGHVDDLPSVLRDFGLGVVASTSSEANCRVGLEWMASGVPLAATRVGALPDIVADGETGFLVTPGRPIELAEKIVYFANNPEATTRMGRAARARVEERFTLEKQADAFEEILAKVTGKRCRT